MASGSEIRLFERRVLMDFVRRCVIKAGASPRHADIIAEILTEADCRGVHSHGLNRLEMYCTELLNKEVDGFAKPKIVRETQSTAYVNGMNGLGMPNGYFCMKLAIKKAKQTGVGWVIVDHSNHYGIAGYYAIMAANSGLVGLSFTNTSPLVVPTRARESALGTNPIAMAVPTSNPTAPWVLDMATSTVPIGKIEVYHRKGDKVPLGWGVDKEGSATTDPGAILNGGGLSPLGGEERTGGYKGYGLAMMVEVFCAVMSAANMGKQVPPWRTGRGGAANVGQCFVAIDPARFGGAGTAARMTELLGQMKGLALAAGAAEVLTHGEPEQRRTVLSAREGVQVHVAILNALDTLAARLQVPPLPTAKASL